MMERPGWTNAMSVGITKVDIQHRTLMRMISELKDSVAIGTPPTSLDRLFLELKAYASIHFDVEERLFESCHHPRLEKHQDLHRSFVDRIDQLFSERGKGKPDQRLQIELLDYLMNWLVRHIQEVDRIDLDYVKKWQEETSVLPGSSR